MAEAVIVLPFFIIVWVGMQSLQSYYTAKLMVQSDAGKMALRSAGDGDCGDVSISSQELGAGYEEQLPTRESGILSNLGGMNPLAVVHVDGEATSDQNLFEQTVTVNGKRTLCCNTKPTENLMELIVDSVGALLGFKQDE